MFVEPLSLTTLHAGWNMWKIQGVLMMQNGAMKVAETSTKWVSSTSSSFRSNDGSKDEEKEGQPEIFIRC